MAKREPIKLTFEAGNPYANSEYFHSGDYTLHYRVDPAVGKEKAKMFMVHGFACNTTFFDELVEIYTKEGIRCVRVDLPNFGFSSRESKDTHYISQTQLLLELMAKLDPAGTGWILVGHSMGGSVVLDIANTDTSDVNAVILNAPLLMFNVPDWMSKLIVKKPICAVMDFALKLVAPLHRVFQFFMILMTLDPLYTLKYDGHKLADPFAVEHAGTGLCYMTSTTRLPGLDNLKNSSIPFQLVIGRLDLFVFPTKNIMLRRALPDSLDFHAFLYGGHCFLQNRAKKTAKLAKKFLKSNDLL